MLDDPGVDHDAVTRLVLCSGKLYYDIVGHESAARRTVAVARIEQLYPFPVEPAAALVASLPEPRGARLGAGGAAEHGRRGADPPPARGGAARTASLRYVGRPWRASPSEGYPTAHRVEQDRIVREALGPQRVALELRLAPCRQHGGRDPRAVSARREHHLAALRGRQPAPEVKSAVGETDRTGGADARHGSMFAHAAAAPRL